MIHWKNCFPSVTATFQKSSKHLVRDRRFCFVCGFYICPVVMGVGDFRRHSRKHRTFRLQPWLTTNNTFQGPGTRRHQIRKTAINLTPLSVHGPGRRKKNTLRIALNNRNRSFSVCMNTQTLPKHRVVCYDFTGAESSCSRIVQWLQWFSSHANCQRNHKTLCFSQVPSSVATAVSTASWSEVRSATPGSFGSSSRSPWLSVFLIGSQQMSGLEMISISLGWATVFLNRKAHGVRYFLASFPSFLEGTLCLRCLSCTLQWCTQPTSTWQILGLVVW